MIYKEYQNVPVDWSLVRLDQIAEINPKKRKKVLQNGEWVDVTPSTLVTFLAMEDVSESAKILNRQDKTYVEVETGYTSFKEQDILVAKITPCFENGKGAWAKGLNNGIGFGTTEFHVIRAKKEINKKWLHYITSSYYFRKRGELNMQGSAGQKRIPTDYVKSYRLPKPPQKEQDEIAEIISFWDEAISKTENLVKAKKQYKKGLIQRLLSGKVRFTEFEGEDWVEKKLGELVKQVKRKVPKPNDDYLSIGIRSHGKGTFQKPDKDPDDNSMTSLYKVKENDLILNITFAWEGAIAIVKKEDVSGYVSHRFPTYEFDTSKLIPGYFRYVITQPWFVYKLGLISPGGAGRNRVMNKKDFLKLKVEIPSVSEQNAIAGVLTTLDREIELLEIQLKKYQKQKKGLMQQLLTGKVRVN